MVKPCVPIVPLVCVLFTSELSFRLAKRKQKHMLNEIFDVTLVTYKTCPYLSEWIWQTENDEKSRRPEAEGQNSRIGKLNPPPPEKTDKLISSKWVMIGSCFVIKAIKASLFLLQSLYCLTYSWDFLHCGFNLGSPSVSSAFPPVWSPPCPDVWRLCLN